MLSLVYRELTEEELKDANPSQFLSIERGHTFTFDFGGYFFTLPGPLLIKGINFDYETQTLTVVTTGSTPVPAPLVFPGRYYPWGLPTPDWPEDADFDAFMDDIKRARST